MTRSRLGVPATDVWTRLVSDPSQLKGNFPNYWAGCYAAPSRGVKTTRRHDPRPRRPPGSREVPTSDETALDRGHILAIVRFHEPAELDPILAALTDGGIELLEVTLDTPGALDAVRRASEAGTFIGAGTVLTSDEVRRAADAGARFVVSPAVIPEVITTALALGLTPVPGAFSPTEVQLARSLGAGMIKLFPASTGGPAHLRALRGPFGGVRFVPTGGIGIADIGAYLAAGAACVGMGTTLTGTEPPTSGVDLDRVRDRAAAAVSVAGEAWPEPR
jgi:2-dehydro-3-deoxyphosphogluconate aldolase/(4S)-4-hydroxy-2-oxoglutarate aldolase